MASLYTTTISENNPPATSSNTYVVGELWLNSTTGITYQLISKTLLSGSTYSFTWKAIGGIPIRRV